MAKELRTVGIPGIDATPWGTHFCQFYETKEGLTDLLVPYFKAGLENNEFCLWVTSVQLNEEDTRKAMTKAVPQFERYVQDGQIEIVPYTEWYLKGGDFDLQRVLGGWIEKLNHALARGYDGMRATGDVTGNISSRQKSSWNDFAEYEKLLDNTIQGYKMVVLCTYALDKCGATAVIDVVHYHQFALIERMGTWELLESPELKQTKGELRKLNEQLETLVANRTTQLQATIEALRESEQKFHHLVDMILAGVYTCDQSGRITYYNRRAVELWGREPVLGEPERFCGSLRMYHVDGTHIPHDLSPIAEAIRTGQPQQNREVVVERPDQSRITVVADISPMKNEKGEIIGAVNCFRDITDRKQAEAVRVQLLDRVMTAQEEERKRIARELHDETGQSLMSLLVGLRAIQDARTLKEAKAQASRLRKVTSQAMKEVQRLAYGLRPTMLDDMGLDAALKRYASDFTQAHGIAVAVDSIGLEGKRLPAQVETTLYRIAQEALTNTVKHAAAKHVNILLNHSLSDIQMIVEDDGVGFEPGSDPKTATPSTQLGLYGMRERVGMLGGVIAVESAPGKGTIIHVRIQLERETT